MADDNKKRKKSQHMHLQKRQGRRSYKEDLEISQLEQELKDGAPPRGSNPLAALERQDAGASTSYASARTFDEMPISQYTKDGLKKAKYITLTAIQRAALPHALCGRDILGAAKTGSGKTLAFLIPLVEKLYRLKWTKLDGVGALVLTPTRELAVQIFEQLQKVGHFHDLSAGLLIGGKNVKEEALRVGAMNILVCTPGRLLQHMDETPGFDTSSLQILVLDEADRILDMGFAATLDAIVANLPHQRQTMLFSATQTKSVRDLARLSLTDPEYLAVHAEATNPTPVKLQQAYMVVDLGQKMDVLWSFIKSHLKAKTIVFLSTCKQVRFVFEAFRKLRPGVPLRCLHGGMKQPKRMGVFYEFCNAQAMVLIATDIAARGLDFPTVDWVVQADCPEDSATYIHRVGRTARYLSSGRALLLLLPSEREAMLAALADAKVPLNQIRPNPAKQQAVTPALQALLSKDQELKEFAQKALVAYLRSVFLQPRKDVFNVAALPVEDFAASLGLASVPRLRFLRRVRGKQEVVEVGGKEALQEDIEEAHEQADGNSDSGMDEDDEDEAEDKPTAPDAKGIAAAATSAGPRSKKRRLDVPVVGPSAEDFAKSVVDNEGDGDDFLVVKKRDVFSEPVDGLQGEGEDEGMGANGKKKKKKRQKIRVGLVSGNRMVFDEKGNALDPLEQLAAEQLGGNGDGDGDGEGLEAAGTREGVYVVSERPEERFRLAASLMRARDREDRARLKQLRKELKLERKAKQRAAALEEKGAGMVATLGRPAVHSDGDDEEEGAAVSDRLDSSDSGDVSDGSEGKGPARVVPRVEVAHLGMAVKPDAPATAAGAKRPSSAAVMSLADQEALALKLLGTRR
ncbi:hypothetical protein Vafri_18644 [Volvox africanus]|uniref:ATP-dependent RNA helicase n=1 Tax=Volvox africanus TaxID=51714 RepID=A0A8J4BT05_9CHLO|nr:hypothetical protein Vafri_18644 [Volvox africanus]